MVRTSSSFGLQRQATSNSPCPTGHSNNSRSTPEMERRGDHAGADRLLEKKRDGGATRSIKRKPEMVMVTSRNEVGRDNATH